ncbi:MAG: hypothetical protein MUO37_06075, partial [Methyloceanibacter sp.]|nr:hypothetical protein [Methyloceanibacter sp.]
MPFFQASGASGLGPARRGFAGRGRGGFTTSTAAGVGSAAGVVAASVAGAGRAGDTGGIGGAG